MFTCAESGIPIERAASYSLRYTSSGIGLNSILPSAPVTAYCTPRSEEHTSELQSPCNLVCRLLLVKKIALCGISLCYRLLDVLLPPVDDRLDPTERVVAQDEEDDQEEGNGPDHQPRNEAT